MGLFDKLQSQQASSGTASKAQKTESIVFSTLPETFEQFTELPQAGMTEPFGAAALAVVAFCFFPDDKELCYRMVDFLRGPRPMNGMEKQFISDRFRDKDYVPRSYFSGATPANNYTPSEPYTIVVKSDTHSYDEENLARLYITSGGADSPRPITLRLAKDGKWYLWEYSSAFLGIRVPESMNPWA